MPDDIETVLKGNNVPFQVKDIQHGRQFSFSDGGKLCSYDSGKLVWQGHDSPLRRRAQELLGPETIHHQSVDTHPPAQPEVYQYSNRVFIVYGHDTGARE